MWHRRRGCRPPTWPAFAVAAVILLAGCSFPTASPSPSPDSIALSAATAAAFVDALQSTDAAAVAALFAPNGTFDDPPEHQSDREGVRGSYEVVFTYGQVAVEASVVLAGHQGAVVRWVYTWCTTSIEPCPDDRGDGARGVSILTMTDGLITNETIYYLAGGFPRYVPGADGG